MIKKGIHREQTSGESRNVEMDGGSETGFHPGGRGCLWPLEVSALTAVGGCWDRETKTRAHARWTSTKRPCRKPGHQRMMLTVKVYQKYTRLTDGDSKEKGSFQHDSR